MTRVRAPGSALIDPPTPSPDPISPSQFSDDTLQRTTPTAPAAGPRPADRSVVPGFEIEGVLGRGGMGVVYQARQTELGRRVALKMILAGGHAGEDDLRRFQTEAEAVAGLQHPGVVQIYQIGHVDGLPYFSLEYVDGGSLAQQLDGTPLPPDEAARLIETVARAIHYAHQRGIVHRDLKPANILLQLADLATPSPGEARGAASEGTVELRGRSVRPKIADFGLAKRLEDEGNTGTGAVLGTPTYMAPEQAQGRTREIGPAADVYALGAILYDLLTGRPPFKGATVLDTLHLVQSVEPVSPRRLQPRVPRDLETITLKCLEKEPARRYGSALELAEDLRAFREGRPVLARPSGWWERAWKWGRRRPAAAALVVVSAISVVGLTVGAVVVAANERALRAEAEAERNEAVAQRLRADRNLRRAFEAGDTMLSHIGRRRLRWEPGAEVLRRGLLQDARTFYEGFAAAEGEGPHVQYQAGLAHARLGEIEEQFGEHEAARRSLEAALTRLRPLADSEPGRADYAEAVARTSGTLGNVLHALGRHGEAEASLREAIRRAAGAPSANHLLAATHDALGVCLQQIPDRQADAEKAFREAARLLDGLVSEEDPDRRYLQMQARVWSNLAALLLAADTHGAEGLWVRAERAHRALTARAPWAAEHRFDLGLTLVNLAAVRQQARRLKEADAASREAVALLDRLVKDFPAAADARESLAHAHAAQARVHDSAGEHDRAEAARERARVEWRRLADGPGALPRYRQELARGDADRARYLWRQGEHSEAKAAWARAAEAQTSLVNSHPGRTEFALDLARTEIDRGQAAGGKDSAKEEGHYRHAIIVLEKAAPKGDPPDAWRELMVTAHQNLAVALLERGQVDGAASALRSVIAHRAGVAKRRPDAVQAGALSAAHCSLIEVLAGHRRHAEVTDAAAAHLAMLREHPLAGWDTPLRSAGALGRCVALAETDAKLSEGERSRLAARHGKMAVALLREAFARGYRDAQQLSRRADLRPLEGRKDFQDLLRQMISPTKGPK